MLVRNTGFTALFDEEETHSTNVDTIGIDGGVRIFESILNSPCDIQLDQI
jgi:hypothetical protein